MEIVISEGIKIELPKVIAQGDVIAPYVSIVDNATGNSLRNVRSLNLQTGQAEMFARDEQGKLIFEKNEYGNDPHFKVETVTLSNITIYIGKKP